VLASLGYSSRRARLNPRTSSALSRMSAKWPPESYADAWPSLRIRVIPFVSRELVKEIAPRGARFSLAVGLQAQAIRQGIGGCKRVRNLIAIIAHINDPPPVVRSKLLPSLVLRRLVKNRPWRSFRFRRETVVEGPNFRAPGYRGRGAPLCFSSPVDWRFRVLGWGGRLRNRNGAWRGSRNLCLHAERVRRNGWRPRSRCRCRRYKNQFQRRGRRQRQSSREFS
jgi:hypothetical protein